MFTPKELIRGSLLLLAFSGAALAQENRASIELPPAPVSAGPLVTVTTTTKRVRFVSPGTVVQLRLEVYNETGQRLFDTELRGGNVLDWHFQDGAGERVPAGSYACVLTIKSLSGRISQRFGVVTMDQEKAAIKAAETAQLSLAQQQTIGPLEGNATFTVMQESEAEAITTVTHDGSDGQMTRTRGALSFRVGDFFSGKDKEQMRLTEDGRLGIGTSDPKAALDVAGTIRTSDGIEFENGTRLTSAASGSLQRTMADGTVVTNAVGTGTQNKIAKWIDNVGTLGDSVITETGGNVGIGTTSPAHRLHVQGGKTLFQHTGTASVFIVDRTDGKIAALGAGGVSSTIAYDQSGIFKIESNSRSTISQGVFGTATGATTRFVINTSGNVGIGIENPATKLDVAGNINTSTQYNIGGSRVLTTSSFSGNIFAGNGAGASNGLGSGNSFFGQGAGQSNVTGASNSFFGRNAGQANTSSANSFFGEDSGFGNSTGGRNSFFGQGSGRNTQTGSDNAFFGYRAGHNNAASNNSFFGSGAGDSVTSGGNNAFFGRNAGSTNTTGSNITLLGANTSALGNPSNATAIGAGAIVTHSNTLVLGNGVNVGIGTTTPNVRLHVAGGSDAEPSGGGNIVVGEPTSVNVVIDNNEIMARNSGETATLALNADGGNVNLIQSGTGNVGIGTNSPGAKLAVNGTARATSLEVNGGTIRVIGAGLNTNGAAFIHIATANNITGIQTIIDHPLCNDAPNAILIITLRYTLPGHSNVSINNPLGVMYDGTRWRIYNTDAGTPMTEGAKFNVLIILP